MGGNYGDLKDTEQTGTRRDRVRERREREGGRERVRERAV